VGQRRFVDRGRVTSATIGGTPVNDAARILRLAIADLLLQTLLAGAAPGPAAQQRLTDDVLLPLLTRPPGGSARTRWFMTFPQEAVRKSRRWLQRRYSNIVFFNEPDRGGHFGALEQPTQLTDDIRTTFAAIRTRG
jgi:hypothetical protein